MKFLRIVAKICERKINEKKKNKLSTLPLFVHLASIAITRNATWSVPFVIQNPAPVKCKTRRRVLKRSVERRGKEP